MQLLDDKEQLFRLLAEGYLVITPNNRLSESIISQYFKQCQRQVIEKPKCLPYGTALNKAYEAHQLLHPHVVHPTLLNSAQCQHLWRTMIKSQNKITYSDGLLKSVISAWERCQLWRVEAENSLFNYTNQTRQFQQWWLEFEATLAHNNLITDAQLIPYLIEAQSSLFSTSVIWVCFDSFTPQQIQLQDYLAQQGMQQYAYDLQQRFNQPQICAASDDKEEMEQLLAWLQQTLNSGAQRIGVVVPDMQQKAQTIQRQLVHHFAPELFNISLGQSLSTFPLVAHAFCWLQLDKTYLSHHQATLLLQSPYLGQAKEEFLRRSEYLQDALLLEDHQISWQRFSDDCASSTPHLAKLLSQIKAYPKQALAHEWVDLFQERLNSLGFPGDNGLNSENYQCLNRFTLLFDELRQLQLVSGQLSQQEALESLLLLAQNTIFQAQKTKAPIQVLGLLEASGCEFDALWVMSLSDQNLPQKVHLSAFIPAQLQRDLHMPHSVPTRELMLAKQTLQRLQDSAQVVVFSYAQLQANTPNLPCSLMNTVPKYDLLVPLDNSTSATELMLVEECYQIPLRPEEIISGGTALLANQAKCPFKAFAEHRLYAKASSLPSDGIDARSKGQIIHKVLELLWMNLKSQSVLFTWTSAQIETEVDNAIKHALESIETQIILHDIELIRLKRLVLAYLELEKQRPAFTIAALEQSYTINIAGLDFKVRVDRLDNVAENKWVIDYKSSLPSSKPWNEERPKEPQLLLYTLLDSHINALLFTQLKTGDISYSGLSEMKQEIQGISSLKKGDTWDSCTQKWQKQLTHLAEEFLQGHCPPQPAQATLCLQCNHQDLCRFQANES